MASHLSDRFLWLCLGVSLFFAVRGIAADLRRVSDLTEIKHVEKEDKIISEGTEDALKLDTLLKLSDSTSYDLRAAALRIIAERSTKGSTRDLLLKDLASKNKERRGRALTALYFLLSNRALARTAVCSRLKDLSTYTALVDCLCNFLKEHVEETSTTDSPILPKTRPLGEKKALSILNLILRENIPAALEAGVVSRWLSKYPFPCALTTPSRRQDVVILMKTWWSDDTIMSEIFSTLSSHPDGTKQLRKYGLMGSMMEENDHDDDEEDSDVWMIDGEDTAGSRRLSGRRLRGGTAEEQAVRRRRREAMVLSDGVHPLNNDDIFQIPIAE
ncbi:hypothetical protein IFM58399_07574 [Aspergillus lentulus]|uniref:Uncharacterized protein n=1 Tax=Aspergillus lentulus TaxID=293939 RepID=A0AAN5YNM4_ASPLE|nr:uncharacterized protein IFM58399_07574 [Aspergillus lentulus]KAF4182711.1 hypothetical protein CNMCM8060_006075 [Aspergillus lentulus]KAF4187787.1 hypothetical protein CNMCM7927_003276 [Aspergillus lentulus]KAF4195854.1 hypothetical protein CNMCM8694_005726 [Aspergillus lentulus]KAF4204363.1 hypothetical protein CNMCM8927_007657 [Aspergillus lentulus]GFF45554.1 hypothetical protein IFM58399_07574 [Aspergillus lentulus]